MQDADSKESLKDFSLLCTPEYSSYNIYDDGSESID